MACHFTTKSGGIWNFRLHIDLYSNPEDMVKNGWRQFDTLEEMNKAADIENQPKGIRNLIVRPGQSSYSDIYHITR